MPRCSFATGTLGGGGVFLVTNPGGDVEGGLATDALGTGSGEPDGIRFATANGFLVIEGEGTGLPGMTACAVGFADG
jgi:hypothetical protein